jgi:hypothetical protein
MNGTIISQRQQIIIQQLLQKPSSRGEIEANLSKQFTSSKITILRDLNFLIDQNWITVTGIGRSVKYQINEDNRLLIPINLDLYFSENSSHRQFIKESFDEAVFDRFHGLYSPREIESFELQQKKLSNQRKVLDTSIYLREMERITVEFAWKSSKIEGNTYTLLETEQLLLRQEEAQGHPKTEAIMILNHKKALDHILTNTSSYQILTVDKILEIHSILINGLGVSTGIRGQQVGISGTNYLPPKNKAELLKFLSRIVDLVNKEQYPLSKALIAVSAISYLQPFNDGNKRTGRMIANAILIAFDCIPLSYRDVEELVYKKSLILFYEQTNIFNFKRIISDQFIYSNSHYFQT